MRIVLTIVAIFASVLLPSRAHADAPLKVVASFSILSDFARHVGGERIDVTTLVPPGGDVHVYQPSPADAKAVGQAALVIVNGLGFEGWLPRLVQSAGGRATTVVASTGIEPIDAAQDSHHHQTDPHAWQSIANAKIYVANIRDALIAADPPGADHYATSSAGYLQELDALEQDIRARIAAILPERRKVISTHAAFGYFSKAYGIAFLAPQGLSTNAEPSARGVAALISRIRAEKIPAVFLENVSDPRLARRIAAESGAKIGGTLYSDALTGENGAAPTYIEMVRHNIKALTEALDR